LIGQLLNLLSDKVVAVVADAGVDVPVVGGVIGALDANSINFDIATLAEAAAFIKILIKSAGGINDNRARLSRATIDLIAGAGSTGSVD
jgi:hypothetical protein